MFFSLTGSRLRTEKGSQKDPFDFYRQQVRTMVPPFSPAGVTLPISVLWHIDKIYVKANGRWNLSP
uniref:Uncharacterized protein n=1 Tax=Salmonella enterica subsp. indica TaxID=59207 RepID=I3W3Z4_SALER|nr:hypothetical protein [Salmonella enterica]AFK90321.1 hypothetical protein [Salmonella enterica subsp. indica]